MQRQEQIKKLEEGISLIATNTDAAYKHYKALSQLVGCDPDIMSLSTDIALYIAEKDDADIPQYFFKNVDDVVEAIQKLK